MITSRKYNSYHFDPYHSHQWINIINHASQEIQKIQLLIKNGQFRSAKKKMIFLLFGNHKETELPNLKSATMYWSSMGHKMCFELNFFCHILGIEYETAYKDYAKEALAIIDLFRQDMVLVLRNSEQLIAYDYYIVKFLEDSLDEVMWHSTWKKEIIELENASWKLLNHLKKKESANEIKKVVLIWMQYALRGRIVQEFYTILGALFCCHVVKERGFQYVLNIVEKKRYDFAWQLCWIFFIGIKKETSHGNFSAKYRSKWLGMKADHKIKLLNNKIITDFKTLLRCILLWIKNRPLRSSMELFNCPIQEMYKYVAMRSPESQNSINIFCKFCETHAECTYLSVLPRFIKPEECGLSSSLAKGESSCRFDLVTKIAMPFRSYAVKSKKEIWQTILKSEPPINWQIPEMMFLPGRNN
jgi:hypothetical protein